MCMLDGTNKDKRDDKVILINFDFFNGAEHKNDIDTKIKELLHLAYGFHLKKYVNDDIINFMKQKFNG